MRLRNLPGGYHRIFYLAYLASFLFFSSMHLLITPLPLYIEAIGGGPVDVGLAGTSMAIAALIFRPFMGRLADTRRRKTALSIGAAVFSIAPLSYIVATSLPAFQVARMFHGIGVAAYTSAYYALIADVTPRSRWGSALGLAGTAPSLAMVIASPMGTLLLEHASFAAVFTTAGLLALASLIVILLLREPSRPTTPSQAGNPASMAVLDVVRLRGVLVPSVVMLALGLTYGSVFSFLPLFALDRGLGNAGFFFTVLSLSVVTSRSVAGRVSDRVGRLPVILPLATLIVLSVVGLNYTYAFGTLLVLALLQGTGFGGTRVVLETMVVDAAPAKARSTALSLVYFCFDTGIATSGLIMGTVAGLAGYGRGYLIIGGICFLTVALFTVLMRRTPTT